MNSKTNSCITLLPKLLNQEVEIFFKKLLELKKKVITWRKLLIIKREKARKFEKFKLILLWKIYKNNHNNTWSLHSYNISFYKLREVIGD